MRAARAVRSALGAAVLALAGCASAPPEPEGPSAEALARLTPPASPGTLAALVAGTPELSTLAAALAGARLDGALDDPDRPLTVLAPTDAAFSALPDGLADALLAEGGRDRLEILLTSSMLEGRMDAADMDAALERGGGRWNLANARGTTLTLRRAPVMAADRTGDGIAGENAGGGATDVLVELVGSDEARVVRADVEATNGALHVIDRVLVPRESARP